MLQFILRWGWNTNLTVCFLEREKEFCPEFFKTLSPEDIWPLLFSDCMRLSNDHETFGRVWAFLNSCKLKDFTLPKPDEITIKIKCTF